VADQKEAKINRNKARREEWNSVPLLPFTSHETMDSFAKQYPEVLFRFYYSRLNKAIKEDARKVFMFRLNENETVYIVSEKFDVTINDLISRAIKVEAYEFVPRFKALLNRHYINRVIADSKK
jgi:hypothetical protein